MIANRYNALEQYIFLLKKIYDIYIYIYLIIKYLGCHLNFKLIFIYLFMNIDIGEFFFDNE